MPLSVNSKICIRHFKVEDINTEKVFRINETTIKLPNLRKSLRKGALPINDSEQTEDVAELKATSSKQLKTYTRIPKLGNLEHTTENCTNKSSNLFENLVKYKSNDLQWRVHINETHVILTWLSNTYYVNQNKSNVKKSIIIDSQCKAKMILLERVLRSVYVKDFDDIDNLVSEMNQINVCYGKDGMRSKQCNRIAIHPNSTCINCRRLRIQRLIHTTSNKLKKEVLD